MIYNPLFWYTGDVRIAEDHKFLADKFLENALAASSRLWELPHYYKELICTDGTIITVRKQTGRPIVTIYSPPVTVEEEEVATVATTEPQYLYIHAITKSFEAQAVIYNCRTKALAEKTLNPDYGLKDSNGDLLYPHAPQYWGIKNPYYGILKGGVDSIFDPDSTPLSDRLFPTATEFFSFAVPHRVLITEKDRDVTFMGGGSGYYYNNPCGYHELKVYTGTKDTRLGGYVTSVTIVNGGKNVRVGNNIDIPPQQAQYSKSARAYVAGGEGARIEVLTVSPEGAATSFKIVRNGTGYVTSDEVLSLNYKGITVKVVAAPADETLHFHKWYTTFCRDGNVQVSKFQQTTDMWVEGMYPWDGMGYDHLGVHLKARLAITSESSPNTEAPCVGAGQTFDKGTSSSSSETVHTVTLYEPDQLREVHQIGIQAGDYSANENLIVSAEKKDTTKVSTYTKWTCEITITDLITMAYNACGFVTPVCGPYNWPAPKQPDFNNCVDGLRGCYRGVIDGQESLSYYATEEVPAASNYTKYDDEAVLYDPIAHVPASWEGNRDYKNSAWSKSLIVKMYTDQMPYVGWGGFRFIQLNTHEESTATHSETPVERTHEENPDRYYWIINSDTLCMWTDSGVSGYPLRWTVDQARWRLVYNSRHDSIADIPVGGWGELQPPYFMQLYVYAYSDRLMGQQSFYTNPTGLMVHASIIEASEEVFQKDGDGASRLLYSANSAGSSPEFAGIVSSLISGIGLEQLASVNASFISYSLSRSGLVDHKEGQEEQTPTGQDPDEV